MPRASLRPSSRTRELVVSPRKSSNGSLLERSRLDERLRCSRSSFSCSFSISARSFSHSMRSCSALLNRANGICRSGESRLSECGGAGHYDRFSQTSMRPGSRFAHVKYGIRLMGMSWLVLPAPEAETG